MTLQFLIGGEAVSAAGNRSFIRHDPVTGEVATVAAAASVADALKAVDAAAAAFPAWAKVGPVERRKLLNKAADIMDSKVGEFIAAGVAETGATGPWIGSQIAEFALRAFGG